jgi:Sec-independent protein translocase protein TatA
VLANLVGDWYWPVIAIVVLFGGSQLPKLARNAGLALSEFRKAHGEATAASSEMSSTVPATSGPSTARAAGDAYSLAALQPAPSAPQVIHEAPLASAVPAASTEERITLTRAELDALLADREARAKANERGANRPQPDAG